MNLIDFILNLAGLLLWLSWRSERFDPLARRVPATLMGTLRPAAPKKIRRWHFLLLIVGLLFLRAVIYRWLVPIWVGRLDLGIIVLPFRSDWFARILVFSFLSFGLMLGIFYVGMLLFSLLKGPDPMHRLVRIPLGRVDGWPRWAKGLLPFVVAAAAWGSISWLLTRLQIFPAPVSGAHRLEQSLILGLESYRIWQYPLGALLLLHLLGSYIYFGKHPLWNYVAVTAQMLLAPLKKIPRRLGRMDFAPVLALALVFLAGELFRRALNFLWLRLPF
jgi:uncharacterized protein YggT (Ycf19 family)